MFRKIFYLCSYCCWRILPGISWHGSHWRRASSALTRSNFNMWVSICGFPYLNCSIWVLICDFQKASCQIRALKCESDVWIYLIYVNVSFNIWILIRELQYVNEWFTYASFIIWIQYVVVVILWRSINHDRHWSPELVVRWSYCQLPKCIGESFFHLLAFG